MNEERNDRDERRELVARWLGVSVGLGAAAIAWYAIRWPAPAISFAIGFAAYLIARPAEH